MKRIYVAFLQIPLIFGACKKDPEISDKVIDPGVTVEQGAGSNYGHVKVSFNQMVGDLEMQIGTDSFSNYLGQNYIITKFKYYISNITLTKTDGTVYRQHESYHLVDNEKGQSYNLLLDSVPPGDYRSIDFMLGVDSTRNTSGAQTGALDPANGMFWTWNQGYIFLMMEGSSSRSSASNKGIFYHLGGFTKPYSCIRRISLPLDNKISVKKDYISKVNIKTNGAQLFGQRNLIDFNLTPSAMGGPVAVKVADNCLEMFTVLSVEN